MLESRARINSPQKLANNFMLSPQSIVSCRCEQFYAESAVYCVLQVG
jgi:hypothetical protein